MIDAAQMRALCNRLYAVMVADVFGSPGIDALFSVLDTVRELYRHVEPSRINGTIVVFQEITNAASPIASSAGELCGSLDLLIPRAQDGLLIGIRADGRRYVYTVNAATPTQLAQAAVVYEFRERQEYFFAGAQSERMIPLVPEADSQFAVPTFFRLREALLRYAQTDIRQSGCPFFSEAWADSNRLFFKPGPEEFMRRSLDRFLKASLGAGYEVRPEQVMDESHPVDIKVTYTPANRLMIIEIKWLGDSRDERDHITVPHRDARAKEGAKQLADYLDQNRTQAPFYVSHGYYVIIDARRRRLRPTATTISREDGMHYANQDIAFDPEYHRIRTDYDQPYRMFAEPICNP